MLGNSEETTGKIMDKADIALIAHIDDEGHSITKAMLGPRKKNGVKEICFTTNTASNKVGFFRENPKVSTYFIDKRFFRGAGLTGTVEVLETPKTKERLWRLEGSIAAFEIAPASIDD